jgi:hypothetical protein
LADHAVIPGHWKGGPSKIGDPQKQGKYEIPPKMIGKILKTNPKLPPKCQLEVGPQGWYRANVSSSSGRR